MVCFDVVLFRSRNPPSTSRSLRDHHHDPCKSCPGKKSGKGFHSKKPYQKLEHASEKSKKHNLSMEINFPRRDHQVTDPTTFQNNRKLGKSRSFCPPNDPDQACDIAVIAKIETLPKELGRNHSSNRWSNGSKRRSRCSDTTRTGPSSPVQDCSSFSTAKLASHCGFSTTRIYD
ncbi:hypothetical protein ACE6H2_002471 [Prunus campanulata]